MCQRNKLPCFIFEGCGKAQENTLWKLSDNTPQAGPRQPHIPLYHTKTAHEDFFKKRSLCSSLVVPLLQLVHVSISTSIPTSSFQGLQHIRPHQQDPSVHCAATVPLHPAYLHLLMQAAVPKRKIRRPGGGFWLKIRQEHIAQALILSCCLKTETTKTESHSPSRNMDFNWTFLFCS